MRSLYVSFPAHQNEGTECGGDLGDVEILIVRFATNAVWLRGCVSRYPIRPPRRDEGPGVLIGTRGSWRSYWPKMCVSLCAQACWRAREERPIAARTWLLLASLAIWMSSFGVNLFAYYGSFLTWSFMIPLERKTGNVNIGMVFLRLVYRGIESLSLTVVQAPGIERWVTAFVDVCGYRSIDVLREETALLIVHLTNITFLLPLY